MIYIDSSVKIRMYYIPKTRLCEMAEFNRRKHTRTNRQGTTFPVSAHQVVREDFTRGPNGQGESILERYTDGSIYFGQFKDGLRNGQGTYTWRTGDEYVGEWKDGKQHGHCTYIYANQSRYVGEFKNGLKNGQGTFTWHDGDEYVGEYKDDEKTGQGTLTFLDGDKYKGEFNNGRYNGRGELSYFNGRQYYYIGGFKDGKRSGRGELRYEVKNVQHIYFGDFKDGKRSGNGELRWDGILYAGQFQDNKPNGHGILSSPDGNEYVGEWKNGKRHGQGTFTKANGRAYTGVWGYDKYIGNDTSSKSDKQIDDGTLATDDGTPVSKEFDTKVVDGPSKFEENTSQETRDAIRPKVLKKMSDLEASKAAELNERTELLQSFPKATDIIEYSEPAKIAWTAIQVLSADYEEKFLAELDKRPEVHPDNLALEVYREFLKERPALEYIVAQNTAISLRAISLKAEDEFARIVGYKNPTISSDDIAERITIKFGEQDGDRAEAFTYFEKLKSEDEAEREFAEKERITQGLLEKEKLERERRELEKRQVILKDVAKPFRMTLSELEKREQEKLERSSKFVFPFFAKKDKT